ncbi:SprB-like repeat protein, partial [Arcicella aurantiaca]
MKTILQSPGKSTIYNFVDRPNIFLFKPLRFLLLFLMFSVMAQVGFGQDNTWTGGAGDGLWTSPANWSLGVPTASHRVVFDASDNVSQTADVTVSAIKVTDNATININAIGGAFNLICDGGTNSVIEAGSTLNLETATGSISLVFVNGGTTEVFAINGTLNIGNNGTFNSANSHTSVGGILRRSSNISSVIVSSTTNLNFLNGGSFELTANAGLVPTATWDINSNLKITGVTNGGLSGMAQNFGNVIWNCAGQSGLTTFTPNLIAGNFDVQNTNSQVLSVTTTPLSIGGNYIQAGYVRTASSSTSRTWNVAGNVTINSGTLKLGEGTGIGTINVIGNFTHNGGTITQTGGGSGQINFDGTTTYTSGGTNTGVINYTVNATKSLIMASASTAITGGGSFTLNSGATIDIKSADGITSSGATGNVQVTGTRTYNTGANYIYSGMAQSLGSGFTGGATLQLKGSGTKTFSNAVAISGATTVDNGVIVALGTFASTTGTLNIRSGGTPAGTWGSTGSSATYKDATYFGSTNTGTLSVGTGTCTAITLSGQSATPTAVTCFGGNNGSIALTNPTTVSGGTGIKTLSYAWSKTGGGFSSTAQNPSSLTAGPYAVTITATDENQCTATVSITGVVVTQPAAITASTASKTDVSCNGGTNGTITLAGAGGTAPYAYTITGTGSNTTGATSGNFTGLPAGTYNYSIT